MTDLVDLLQEGRQRERAQALFYRFLSGDAESSGDVQTAERLNELLADEQHHVSRLTARILELGVTPRHADVPLPEVPTMAGWEDAARAREEDEVRWYTEALQRVDDPGTRSILQAILNSERHHRDELAGKWMPAALTEPEEEV